MIAGHCGPIQLGPHDIGLHPKATHVGENTAGGHKMAATVGGPAAGVHVLAPPNVTHGVGAVQWAAQHSVGHLGGVGGTTAAGAVGVPTFNNGIQQPFTRHTRTLWFRCGIEEVGILTGLTIASRGRRDIVKREIKTIPIIVRFATFNLQYQSKQCVCLAMLPTVLTQLFTFSQGSLMHSPVRKRVLECRKMLAIWYVCGLMASFLVTLGGLPAWLAAI